MHVHMDSALHTLLSMAGGGGVTLEGDGGRGDEGEQMAEAGARSLTVIAGQQGLAGSLLANGPALEECVRRLRCAPRDPQISLLRPKVSSPCFGDDVWRQRDAADAWSCLNTFGLILHSFSRSFCV